MDNTRFLIYFDSAYDQTKYRINITDSDYVGSPITSIGINGMSISWDGEEDNLTEPIRQSQCKFIMLDDGSANMISFQADLLTSQENEHKLYVEKYDGSTWNLFWAGVIMADLISTPNRHASAVAPRDFQVVAKDGLNRLANIEFDLINSSPYISSGVTTPQSFLKIIFDCLSYSGTAQFFTGDYLRIGISWVETTQHLDNSTATKKQQRILECLRIDRDFLFDHEFDDHGQGWTKTEHWKWLNEYGNQHTRLRSYDDPALRVRTTLREILGLLRLQIKQSNGIWYIQQLNVLTASTVTYARYNNAGTYTNVITENIRVSPQVLANGTFSFLPCVKSAKATVLPSDILNVTQPLSYTLVGSTLSNTQTIQLGTLYGGSQKLTFEYTWRTLNWNINQGANVRVTFQLVANDGTNDWALKHSHTNAGITPVTWTNTAADVCTIDLNALGLNKLEFTPPATVLITTPEIPFTDSCNNATLVITTTVTPAAITSIAGSFIIMPFNVRLVDTDGNIGVISDFISYNPDMTMQNSVDIELGKLRIHDTGIISSKNSIEVDDYVGAGRWFKAGVFDAGFDHNESLVKTILKETVAFQRKPVKKYIGKFTGSYNPHQVLGYDADYWVLISGTYDLYHDEIDGVWFKIAHEPNGVLQPTTDKGTDMVKGFTAGGNTLADKAGLIFRTPGNNSGFFPIVKGYLNGSYVVGGGPYSQLDIDASLFQHLKSADIVYLIHPQSRQIIDQVQITADMSIGDTSINVLSYTPVEEIGYGVEISTNLNKLCITNELRAVEKVELGYGDSVAQEYILKARTTNTTTTELTLDGATGLGTTNRVQIPTNSACLVELLFSVKQDSSANCGKFKRELLIYNNGGTVALNGAVQNGSPADINLAPPVTITAAANNTNDCLRVEVNGLPATNLNWTCLVRMTVSRY